MRRKNVVGLLNAIAIVRTRYPDVELTVAGESVAEQGYRQEVENEVRRLQLEENVRFVGQLDDPLLARQYSRCSIVTQASREETAGMALQQAMACGRAVVATRVGGVPFVVPDGSCGFLVADEHMSELGE